MQLVAGEQFAGYTVIRSLGAGGMGEVYLARHPRLPRNDALKVLPAGISQESNFRERFIREADLSSALWHANIVSVYDRGEYNGQLWIAMEYVEGIDAGRRLSDLQSAGMPVDEVTGIVSAVAAALDHAHSRGLLHRDVKPANIMLAAHDGTNDDDRRILLTDFGIARPLDEASGLTTTNMTVGTVAYAAPEQLMGERIDGRVDQYGLAASAYHLLSGQQLFPQSNAAVVISRHLNADPPPLSTTRPELAALDPVLARALAKDPADRYLRCSDFARSLKAATSADARAAAAPTASALRANRKTAPLSPLNRERRQRWRIGGSAAAIVVLLVLTLLLWWQPWGPPTDSGASAPSTSNPLSTSSSSTTPPSMAAAPPSAELLPITTTPAVSKAGFYGEWGQHSTSVTLAPDGSAHYAVWLGAANGVSWSATWSPMTSTTAMIVLATELDSHGDTSDSWMSRYGGEALTFTLRPDGYATISNPSGEPINLCPRNSDFRDSQGLCGA